MKPMIALLALAGSLAVMGTAFPGDAAFPGASGDIAFQRDGGTWVASLESGSESYVGGGFSPTWSPDGQRIAFAQDFQIYIMNAVGTGVIQLTNDPGLNDGDPAWSPKGDQLAFSRGGAGLGDIYVMSTTGGDQTNITNNGWDDRSPSWSPGGTMIAFSSDRDEPDRANCYPSCKDEIYTVNPAGSGSSRLTFNAAYDIDPDWSPDGSKIAFSRCETWLSVCDVYVMNADGTGQIALTNNAGDDLSPAWSPDGRKIAFSSDREGNPEIYVMSSDGTGQTRVTYNLAYDSNPTWQPLGALRGDINCDGLVNSVDSLLILRYVAQLPVNLPSGCPEIGS